MMLNKLLLLEFFFKMYLESIVKCLSAQKIKAFLAFVNNTFLQMRFVWIGLVPLKLKLQVL